MEPSTLRLLAEQHANKSIDTATYRARRRALIQAIERGDTDIVRGSADVAAPTSRAWPRALALGALCAGAIALGAALLGRDDEETGAVEPTAAIEVNAPRQQISEAQGLVQAFLTHRDFSASALESFATRWRALPRAERGAARDADWFAAFTRSVTDEIRTQLALAELGTTAPARERVTQLRAFASSVGLRLDEAALRETRTRQATEGQVAAQQNLGGAEWLAIQASDRLTLQLFAVNALDHVGQLMQRYATLDMHVLKSELGTPSYRVVHGSFDDVEQAKTAYDQLPEDVRALSNGAIVKSIAALRDDLSASQAAAAPVARSQSREDENAESFTLQLFATASATNAQALVAAFPELGLTATTVADSPSPHRVLLGRYASVDDARAARKALPPELLSRIGRPLIKQRKSLGLR